MILPSTVHTYSPQTVIRAHLYIILTSIGQCDVKDKVRLPLSQLELRLCRLQNVSDKGCSIGHWLGGSVEQSPPTNSTKELIPRGATEGPRPALPGSVG